MDDLLADLARVRIGSTFNQYAEAGPDDVPGAAAVRVDNLRAYLAERAGADVVALGEAAGYQGMRWSGIAFTSERDLARWGDPYRPSCSARRWSEPSGTIAQLSQVDSSALEKHFDSIRAARIDRPSQSHHAIHSGFRTHYRLNFAQFDALPKNLNLIVHSS